jgi:hypothetical protein
VTDDDRRMAEAARALAERLVEDAELPEPRGRLSKAEAYQLEKPVDVAMREALEDMEYEARVSREALERELAAHLPARHLHLVKSIEHWTKAEAIARAELERKGWR